MDSKRPFTNVWMGSFPVIIFHPPVLLFHWILSEAVTLKTYICLTDLPGVWGVGSASAVSVHLAVIYYIRHRYKEKTIWRQQAIAPMVQPANSICVTGNLLPGWRRCCCENLYLKCISLFLPAACCIVFGADAASFASASHIALTIISGNVISRAAVHAILATPPAFLPIVPSATIKANTVFSSRVTDQCNCLRWKYRTARFLKTMQ